MAGLVPAATGLVSGAHAAPVARAAFGQTRREVGGARDRPSHPAERRAKLDDQRRWCPDVPSPRQEPCYRLKRASLSPKEAGGKEWVLRLPS